MVILILNDTSSPREKKQHASVPSGPLARAHPTHEHEHWQALGGVHWNGFGDDGGSTGEEGGNFGDAMDRV